MENRQVDLSWAGGYFEGEGSFCVCRRKNGKYYDTSIQASSVDFPLLEHLQKIIGGSIYGSYKPSKSCQKSVWVWNVVSSKQIEITQELLPYLVIKKERAELLIEARTIINSRRGKHKGNQYTKIIYDPYPIRLEEIYQRMKQLNKRGS